MSKSYKALPLVVIGLLSVGAVSVWDPRPYELDNKDAAPIIGPIYARPVEKVETHQLNRGETLSGLLSKANVGDIGQILTALAERQNLRRLMPGTEVTVRRWAETDEPRAVDVRINPDTTIRLARNDIGWTTDIVLTPVTVDTVFVSGEIAEGRSVYSSIYEDETLNLPADEKIGLIAALAGIYEYKLDFAHEIQPGDQFALAYEREARPDGTARSRRILVARIKNRGTPHDAIYFTNDEVSGYYDLKGKSLKSGFRKYPVDYVRITSSFSRNRNHPLLGVNRAHNGTDFGASTGTPVKATGPGTVTFASRNGGYGNLVMIRHINGYSTRYAHLSRFAKGIRPGVRVEAGDVIGYVGATGLATGPHLHYELHLNGRPINAASAKLPEAPGLPSQYMAQFRELVRDRYALLERANGARFASTTGFVNPTTGGGI